MSLFHKLVTLAQEEAMLLYILCLRNIMPGKRMKGRKHPTIYNALNMRYNIYSLVLLLTVSCIRTYRLTHDSFTFDLRQYGILISYLN